MKESESGYVVWEHLEDWGEPIDVRVSWYRSKAAATRAAGNVCVVTPLSQPYGKAHLPSSLLSRMVDHAGCNCWDGECFTKAERGAAFDELENIRALLPPPEGP